MFRMLEPASHDVCSAGMEQSSEHCVGHLLLVRSVGDVSAIGRVCFSACSDEDRPRPIYVPGRRGSARTPARASPGAVRARRRAARSVMPGRMPDVGWCASTCS